MQYWRAQTKDQLENCFKHLRDSMPESGWRIEWKPWRDIRSLNANALYWEWMAAMAKHFTTAKKVFTKDDMHDLMRHLFLGYENKVIGKTEIPAQLVSTSALDTAQMHAYMSKIDAWAADHGCLLPRPEDSTYSEWQRAAA